METTAVGAPGATQNGTGDGGNGAEVSATVPHFGAPVHTRKLYVEVGCAGELGTGGFNVGGSTDSNTNGAEGGGGASDARTTSIATVPDSAVTTANDSRLVVADGGGGKGHCLTAGGIAGDTNVTGPGNGGNGSGSKSNRVCTDATAGGNGGSPGTTPGTGGKGAPLRTPRQGLLTVRWPPGALGQGGSADFTSPDPNPFGGGGGGYYDGGGYYGGGGGASQPVAAAVLGPASGISSATGAFMSEDGTGTPEIVISPIKCQEAGSEARSRMSKASLRRLSRRLPP